MPQVTMAQLATRAGVCKATISLALRNDPRISAEVRQRVRRVADELGYTRNPLVDELMSQLRRSRVANFQRTIALLNAHRDRRVFTDNPTVPLWVDGCQRRARHLGWHIDEFWLHNPELDGESLLRILLARGIRGAVVIGAFNVVWIPARFRPLWDEIACVVTGIRTRSPALSFTCVDHHNLVLDAMTRLRALGYRRPGLVLSQTVDRVTDGRFTCGMWLAQQALPEADRVPALTGFPTDDDGAAPFSDWYRQHRPDAVLTLHTVVRDWLGALGREAPRDLGLVHLERTRETAWWAGMEQHNDVAGEAAIDLLGGMLHNHEYGVPA
ncbi:MAG: LacI family transcriptional regulator, partial [Verrucomicrobia bacterium]|nr:LacI family transcriptional regulator [Verrucomicrobiota bacterium]